MNFKFQTELILDGRPVNNATDNGRNVIVIFRLTWAEDVFIKCMFLLYC